MLCGGSKGIINPVIQGNTIYTGDVMGDLNKRRGRVLGMNPVGSGKTVIEADVPMTGMFGYCTVLRSMTGGRGTYEYEFARYEQAPSDVDRKSVV